VRFPLVARSVAATTPTTSCVSRCDTAAIDVPCGLHAPIDVLHRAFARASERRLLGTSPRNLDVDITRLNWGCGPTPPSRWINADRLCAPGVTLRSDIRDGLALPDDSVDYAVAIHALQDLPYLDVVPALRELRRVLRPGGVLRLGLPDLERSIDAWLRRDAAYFYIPDDEARSLGGKLILQAIWYGSTRTPFTWDFFHELATKAEFRRVTRCKFRYTGSAWPDIVSLDNRERETLLVEAAK
jgi:SAM-dependent methyltransferase